MDKEGGPEVAKRANLQELRSELEKQQHLVYILELFGELLKSSTREECRELNEFLQDVANNNLSLEVTGDQKLIRGFFRDKSRKLILGIREKYAGLLQDYQLLAGKVSQWNVYRNQVNIDLEYHEKNIVQSKVLREDALGIYDPDLKRLCTEIQSAKFMCQPKGPIGASFSILGEWKPIVEHLLRPFLFIFLVDNRNDWDVLQGLIDKIYGELVPSWPIDYSQHPCVWITKFDIPKPRVEKCRKGDLTLITLMDVLRIHDGDKAVTKFLLDYTRMDRILLFRTQHEAFPILSEKKSLPKGCLHAYTLDFYKVNPHPNFRSVQLESGDAALGFPEYLATYPNPVTITRTQLKGYRKSRDELEGLLGSMKTLQLELMERILQRKEKIETLQKGFDLLRKVPWAEFEGALDTLLASILK